MPSQGRAFWLVLVGSFVILLESLTICALLYYLFAYTLFTSASGLGTRNYTIPAVINNYGGLLLAQMVLDIYINIGIYAGVSVVLFLLMLVAALKIRSRDLDKSLRWARIAFVLIFIYVLVEISLPQSLFANVPFAYSLVSAWYRVLFSSITAVQGTIPLNISLGSVVALIPFLIVLLGGLMGVAGAAYGLGVEHKRYMVNAVVAIAFITAVLAVLSIYQLNYSNSVAFNQLNNTISTYGGNVRYMLSNTSLFYAAFGTQNVTALSGLLHYTVSGENFSALLPDIRTGRMIGVNDSQSLDWNAYNPVVRSVIIGAFYALGFPISSAGIIWIHPGGLPTYPGFNESSIFKHNLIPPKRASTLQSFYELSSSGVSILSTAVVLGRVFACAGFRANSTSLSTLPKSFGVGMIVLQPIDINSGQITTELLPNNGDLYRGVAGLPFGWLMLMYDSNLINGVLATGHFQCVNSTNMTVGQFFYLLSLNQYEDYLNAEVLFNKSVGPNVEFVGYSGSTLVTNLGNLDLNNANNIRLVVDNKTLVYTRYYNFLVSKNVSLGVGLHTMNVSIRNLTLSRWFYVSPYLAMRSSLFRSGRFYLAIGNLFNGSLSISNLTVNASSPAFLPLGFSGGAPSITNLTKPISLVIPRNRSVNLTFATSFACNIAQSYVYYLSFNSSRGRGFYILESRCS